MGGTIDNTWNTLKTKTLGEPHLYNICSIKDGPCLAKSATATLQNVLDVGEQDVLNAFRTIKSNAEGMDRLNLKIWKLVLPYCLPALTHIINKSLETGKIPQLWKTAAVIPVPKVIKPSSPSDLRPISILPLASKILEKIVMQQVSEFANKYILPSTQSGRANDYSMISLLVLLDYSKAFDIINHQLLVAKLHYYNFDNSVISWFLEYLTDRKQ
ncbi:unnamed protein product [Brassicogethes aeneus]|uniref:Reverse transcriptase domain-containing protein n=1 Tax=Brassicogethes aeneus TaxID=1431903 RepID=A0A9P0FEF1_BRAAE|nr:unnamed protein product [Brassicogethes aeneus]